VRVTAGEQDNFLLNYAVKLLDEEMKKLNSSFVFDYYQGDHFTVLTPEVIQIGNLFLEKKYQEWLANHK
jgi:hypothetical protein